MNTDADLDTDAFISLKRKEVTETLQELFREKECSMQKSLFAAASHSLFPTGKLLRPLLCFAVAESYGVAPEAIVLPACSLEIVHTYSLIHDDLPCMDDDDFRRGKPSLHKVYTEGHAVLTGDFLLTFAFEILTKAPHLTDSQKLALITVLSQKGGSQGMIGGQNLDLSSTGRDIDWETLEKIHIGKTSALFQASLSFGAILANAPESDKALLEEFGKLLGLSFQIIDDVLDVTGNEKELGKPVGSDAKKQKVTAVGVLGLEKAKEYGNLLSEKAVNTLLKLSTSSPHLENLTKKLLHRIS